MTLVETVEKSKYCLLSKSRYSKIKNLVRFAHNWNVGLPSPSRDRDGIGRRDLPGIQCCRCNTWGAEVIKSSPCKPGLGQGILGFGEMEYWDIGKIALYS